MRTNARSLSALASALLLAASAVAVSGCGKPEAPAARSGLCRQAKIVIVMYDAGTGKAYMSPSDKTIQLSFKNKDYVQWVSPDGLVYVDKWTPESPFDSPPKHEKKVLKSGPPKKTGLFTYEARLVLFSDGTEHPIDPIIEVME
jgi:hypothetical protein